MFARKDSYGGYALFLYDHTGFITRLDEPPEELSFREAWSLGGSFVFLPLECGCREGFLSEYLLFARSFDEWPLLTWVENPDSPRYLWRLHFLQCVDCDGVRTIKRTQGFAFSSHVFLFQAGVLVTPDFRGVQFKMEADGGGSPLSFQLARAFFATRTGVTVSMDGTLAFRGWTDGSKDTLTDTGVGLKYCRPLLRDLKDEEEAYRRHYVNELHNPVFRYQGGMELDCRLHPSEPLNHERTYFRLPSDWALGSNFTNTRGNPLTFRTTDDSKMVFQEYPYGTYVKRQKRYYHKAYYLTYMGGFLMESGNSQEWLLGLVSTEYGVLPQGNAVVTFEPDGAALLTEEGLDGEARTAWVRFPSKTVYYSQSNASPYFHYAGEGCFRFHPVALVETDGRTGVHPVFPYKGMAASSPDNTKIMEMEKSLYAKRYYVLTGKEPEESSVTVAGNDTVTIVTPQGVMAAVAGGSNRDAERILDWVAIGNASEREGEDGYIRFWGADFHFGTLFMKSDLMVLFQKPRDIMEHVQGADGFMVEYVGLQFAFDPARWRERTDGSSTMMVVKYSTNESVREAFADSDVLKASIAKCLDERNECKKPYEEFYHAVNDKAFMGVIVFNCEVRVDYDAGNFIKELKPVLEKTGTDADIFAHHVIIRRNRVEWDGRGAYLKKSSISLLIDYESDDQIAYGEETSDYGFLTTAFRFAVKDGEVNEVGTVSELLVNRLFDMPANKDDVGGNCLIIDGKLQKTETIYGFQYQLRESNTYRFADGMLGKVRIDEVGLTLADSDDGCFFMLSGGMFFGIKNNVDLFSYGEWEEEGVRYDNELLFHGLKIAMPGQGAMYASYDGVSLDQANSKARRGSFADGFPAVLEPLLVEKYRLPDNLGFIAIQTPLTAAAMEAPWYGLLWRVPLGSLGGLSSASGLEIKLLMAWGKGKDGQGLYMGVSLPGIASGLDLQGILKLGFSSVMLVKGEDDAGYVLKLHQFTVKLLGFSFPKGVSDVYVFADKGTKKLGWYAAYMEKGGDGNG